MTSQLTSQQKKTLLSCSKYEGPDAPPKCRNIWERIPMSKECNMYKNSKTPMSRVCDLQMIQSFKRMNVSMADSLCASMPKHRICGTPAFAKMCTGDWFCKR